MTVRIDPAVYRSHYGVDEAGVDKPLSATLIETEPGHWVVRFEDFSVRNGPNLFVYLSPDPAGYAKGAVELGPLKATDGAFNTKVPPGTDAPNLHSVVVWCKQFGVQFAVAPLN